MPEPMEEVAEESWIEALNRFDQEIYPTLFRDRGYTKADAYIIWSLARIENAVEALAEKLDIA